MYEIVMRGVDADLPDIEVTDLAEDGGWLFFFFSHFPSPQLSQRFLPTEQKSVSISLLVDQK